MTSLLHGGWLNQPRENLLVRWIGLDWARLVWASLGWSRLGWAGLG